MIDKFKLKQSFVIGNGIEFVFQPDLGVRAIGRAQNIQAPHGNRGRRDV